MCIDANLPNIFPTSCYPFLTAFFHFIIKGLFKDVYFMAEESLQRIPFMFLHVVGQTMDIGMQPQQLGAYMGFIMLVPLFCELMGN